MRTTGLLFTVVLVSTCTPSLLGGQSYPPIVDASTLDGSNGFALWGEVRNGRAGEGGEATDVNGDGIPDLFVSAPRAFRGQLNEPGEAYVLYGGQEFPPVIQLSSVFLGNGLEIEGLSEDFAWSGESLAGVGDVNGDGFGDLLIGVSGSDRPTPGDSGPTHDEGEAFLIFGRPDLKGRFGLDDFGGAHGVRFEGNRSTDRAGLHVAAVGDVNGDGLSDFGIGAPLEFPSEGGVYVVFGSQSFPDVVSLGLVGGGNGFFFKGTSEDDDAYRVARAGDLNQDGFDDVLIGALRVEVDSLSQAGATYVVYGRASFPGSPIRPHELNGENGFVIEGFEADSFSGMAHGIGDFNGDGLPDLVVGAEESDFEDQEAAGAAYVIFGRKEGFPSRVSLEEIDGTNGFVLHHEEEQARLGSDTAGAGDINGDGLDDLVVGASGLGNNTGAGYVVFGTRESVPAKLSALSLDGTNGFAVIPLANNTASAGDAVAAVGDVNQDGLADFLVGDRNVDLNDVNSGAIYIVFGQSPLRVEATGDSCPGPFVVEVTGATPNATLAVLTGDTFGESPLPAGTCDLDASVAQPRLLQLSVADEDGSLEFSGNLPASACNTWLQVVDTTACRKSTALRLP